MSKVVHLFASKHTRGFAACSLAAVVLMVFSLVAPYLCHHDAELANLMMANRAPGGNNCWALIRWAAASYAVC